MEEIYRDCTFCKKNLVLSNFSKGNAKYGRKSYCKSCQMEDHRKYRSKPGKKEHENNKAKERWNNQPKYIKTLKYLEKIEYYEEWKEKNPQKFRANSKASAHRRRLRLKEVDRLQTSSIVFLENYNINHFSSVDFKCEYCSGIISGTYYLDHIIPIIKNGTNDLINLAISCLECNGTRGKWKSLLTEWKPELQVYINLRNKQWKL